MKRCKTCGDCARFIPINETDGECLRYGATTCYVIVNCKDFVPIPDHQTEKGGEDNA